MRMLWPESSDTELDDADLERLYAFPETGERPWVAVNFVAGADGAAAVAGSSRGLSGRADHRVFTLGRDLADVVLVGAGTAVGEGYRGIRAGPSRAARRRRHGLAEVPPVAVVTRECSIPPGAPLLTDTGVPPVVLTRAHAPAERREALAAAGADVVVAGQDEVDLPAALRALAARGLYRVCCEGGPRLFGALLARGLVDELRLTVSPVLTAGDTTRIAGGPALPEPTGLKLASVLIEDSTLLLRYRLPTEPATAASSGS